MDLIWSSYPLAPKNECELMVYGSDLNTQFKWTQAHQLDGSDGCYVPWSDIHSVKKASSVTDLTAIFRLKKGK